MQNDTMTPNSLTEDLVRALIKERRAERRWRNIRFFAGILLTVLAVLLIFGHKSPTMTGSGNKDYVALIRLDGMIAPSENFSAETVVPILKEAFTDADAKGVVLDINSGGGTPVQAAIIHDEIIRLKNKYHKKVIVVGEDLLASGAYYVAVSADKIYVNPNTVTGSIGVIMKGFGFPEAMKKLGIERRVFAAGENKDRLDPFLPRTPEDVAKIKEVIDEVHANFIEVVMAGRKGKLKADPKTLFSGDFWPGKTALKLGLVDGLGNLSDVLQNEFKVTRYKDYSQNENIMKAFFNKVGMSFGLSLNNDAQLLEKI